MSNDTIEQCEESFLRERNSDDPDPTAESTAENDGWWRYTVESSWGNSYRDEHGTVVVDHYVEAHYHLGDGDRYRTEERVSDPTTGRSDGLPSGSPVSPETGATCPDRSRAPGSAVGQPSQPDERACVTNISLDALNISNDG